MEGGKGVEELYTKLRNGVWGFASRVFGYDVLSPVRSPLEEEGSTTSLHIDDQVQYRAQGSQYRGPRNQRDVDDSQDGITIPASRINEAGTVIGR